MFSTSSLISLSLSLSLLFLVAPPLPANLNWVIIISSSRSKPQLTLHLLTLVHNYSQACCVVLFSSLTAMDSWLPTEEELLLMDMDMDKHNKNGPISTTEFKPGFRFPNEFPYEFDSLPSPPSLNSSLHDSPAETESSSDEDDFLTGLTRRLTQKLTDNPDSTTVKKKWVMAGSPESTLSGAGSCSASASSNGSPNGMLSPAATPFGSENDTWDLIYAAAGQIARLKMNSGATKEGNHMSSNIHGRGLSGHVNTQFSVTSAVKNQNPSRVGAGQSSFPLNLHQNSQNQNHGRQISVWEMQKMKAAAWVAQQNHRLLQQQVQSRGGNAMGFENGRNACPPPTPRQGLTQSGWVNLQLQQNRQLPQVHYFNSDSRAHYLGGSCVKRESTGTGVFLPRRYGNTHDSKKNLSSPSACSNCLLLPPKVAAHAVNLEFDDMNMNAHHTRPGFNSAFRLSEYDALMVVRRNGVYGQKHKRSLHQEGMVNHEMRLPQEWTY